MSHLTTEATATLIPRTYLLSWSLAIGSSLFAPSVSAQTITIDSSTATTLSSGTPSCTGSCIITGGNRDGNGSGTNLFHSFTEFNVGNGFTTTFEDPGVTNIFSRVTGSNLSNINGTLSVDGPANLFLLNSNGILFGDNAKIDIQGSFLGTTAQSFVFDNNNQFSTTNTSQIPSLLRVSTPIGVQFGTSVNPIELTGTGNRLLYSSRGIRRNFFPGPPPAPISGLSVPTGETVALLGGGVNFQGGNLITENGHAEVGSVGSNSFVTFTDNNSQWQFDYSQVSDFEDISFSNLSSIDVSGSDAGSIHLQGRQLSIDGGSSLLAQVSGNGDGNIQIDASEKLQLTGVSLVPPPTGPFMQSSIYVEIASTGTGNGASSLIVNSPEIDIRDGAQIGLTLAGTTANGVTQAGNVKIQNARTINIDGLSNVGPSSIFTTVAPLPSIPTEARGGNLSIDTEQLTISNGASVAANTFGAGQGGGLSIDADTIQVNGFGVANTRSGLITVPSIIETASLTAPDDSQPSSSPIRNGSGSSGSANLTTRQLVVADGGQIRTGTNSNNPAGDFIVNATESITLSGRTSDGRSGIFSSAREGSGAGGSITVKTPELSILDGATIDAGNFPSSETSDRAAGTGPAGNINLTAQSILLDNDGVITADTVMGDRANITIQTEDIILRNGSKITTNATGTATGGNINIDTTALIALENSDITANAQSNTGGRIIIDAQTILGTAYREALTNESDITATSALGPVFSGTVELNTPDVTPTDGLTNSPPHAATTEQIVAACEQLGSNTFVATGRGGLPEGNNQLAIGESIWNDFRFINNKNATAQTQNSHTSNTHLSDNHADFLEHKNSDTVSTTNISEAQTWFTNLNGEIVLSAAPNAQVATSSPTDCLAKA